MPLCSFYSLSFPFSVYRLFAFVLTSRLSLPFPRMGCGASVADDAVATVGRVKLVVRRPPDTLRRASRVSVNHSVTSRSNSWQQPSVVQAHRMINHRSSMLVALGNVRRQDPKGEAELRLIQQRHAYKLKMERQEDELMQERAHLRYRNLVADARDERKRPGLPRRTLELWRFMVYEYATAWENSTRARQMVGVLVDVGIRVTQSMLNAAIGQSVRTWRSCEFPLAVIEARSKLHLDLSWESPRTGRCPPPDPASPLPMISPRLSSTDIVNWPSIGCAIRCVRISLVMAMMRQMDSRQLNRSLMIETTWCAPFAFALRLWAEDLRACVERERKAGDNTCTNAAWCVQLDRYDLVVRMIETAAATMRFGVDFRGEEARGRGILSYYCNTDSDAGFSLQHGISNHREVVRQIAGISALYAASVAAESDFVRYLGERTCLGVEGIIREYIDIASPPHASLLSVTSFSTSVTLT